MTWLSRRVASERAERQLAAEGVVSIGGGEPAVVTDGETRGAAVIAPGGYHWQPETAQRVLVLRGARESVLGVESAGASLAPGEVEITAHGASIRLLRGGRIELTGAVTVNGKELVL